MKLMKKWFGQRRSTATAGDSDLLAALQDVQQGYEALESLFNMTSDTDMIEYYAHQYKALDARYAYLIKQARAQGITYSPRLKETVVR